MLIKDLWPNLDDIIEPISHKLNFKTEDLVSSWQTNEMPTSQRQQNGSNGKVPSTVRANSRCQHFFFHFNHLIHFPETFQS